MFGDKTFGCRALFSLFPDKEPCLFLPQLLHEPHHDERQHGNHPYKYGKHANLCLLPPAKVFFDRVRHSHAVNPDNSHRVMPQPVFVFVPCHHLVNKHRVALRPLIDKHAVVQVDAVTQPSVNVNAVNTHRRHRHVPRRCATEQQRQYRARQQSPKQTSYSIHIPIFKSNKKKRQPHRRGTAAFCQNKNCLFLVREQVFFFRYDMLDKLDNLIRLVLVSPIFFIITLYAS